MTQGKNLTKSVVTTELTKFLRRRSICMLGNTSQTVHGKLSQLACISVVLNNFIKKRWTTVLI